MIYLYIYYSNPKFIPLWLAAIGCPDVKHPPGGWTKLDGDVLVVTCEGVARTWRLICDGKEWKGETGNCDVPHGRIIVYFNHTHAFSQAFAYLLELLIFCLLIILFAY